MLCYNNKSNVLLVPTVTDEVPAMPNRLPVTVLSGFLGAGKSTLIKLLCRFYDPDGRPKRLRGTSEF